MTARKNIPNASSYEIDPDGFVYHKDNRLQLQRRGKCWVAQIYTDSGHRQNIDSSCYLVHETLKRGRAFVTLRNHGGMRKLLKVENVVKRAWEY